MKLLNNKFQTILENFLSKIKNANSDYLLSLVKRLMNRNCQHIEEILEE